jgi:hypothetical protein
MEALSALAIPRTNSLKITATDHKVAALFNDGE